MDLPCFRSRSRLKIRRAPSCKISATSPSSQTSSSFHGSCTRLIKKKEVIRRQPLIFHTFDPEVRVIEPAEFMAVVQRLTGSAQTRRALRTMMRKVEEVRVLKVGEGADGDELQQEGKQAMQESRGCKDPLKEGTTIILAPSSPKPHLPEREREELNKTRGGSPGSPSCSSLTTRSSEGGACLDEDASTNFFVFSGDSYYGNSDAMELHNSIPLLHSSSDHDHIISLLPSETNSYLSFFKEEEAVSF